MWVVLAGAMMNFVFGVIAFGVIYTIIGIPTEFTFAKIEVVAPGSPAEEGAAPAEGGEAPGTQPKADSSLKEAKPAKEKK